MYYGRMNTTDLLAELEDLGAIGDKVSVPTSIKAAPEEEDAEAVGDDDDDDDDDEDEDIEIDDGDEIEESSELPELNEKGYKIVALTDLVVEEFDRMISSMSTVRDAIRALRQELINENIVDSPKSAPTPVRVAKTPMPVEEYNAQGEPDNWGNISINIPPSVPLPNGE